MYTSLVFHLPYGGKLTLKLIKARCARISQTPVQVLSTHAVPLYLCQQSHYAALYIEKQQWEYKDCWPYHFRFKHHQKDKQFNCHHS